MGVLPPIVARRVELLKCLNTERERVVEKYLKERAALETKYPDLCKPLYKETGNVVAGRLDDDIEMINKDWGVEKEEEWSKIDENIGNDNSGDGEEREGDASLGDSYNNDNIYDAIASRGTTSNNFKAAKYDDNEEGRMVRILQLWVCAMGHMEALAKLITERDI